MVTDDMEQSNISILCIEDDSDTCNLIEFVFKQEGCSIKTCERSECLDLIHKETFTAIILDNYFGEMSGVEICREIRKFDRRTPIVFFSGEVRQVEIDKAMKAGGNAYLIKPNDFEKLVKTTVKLISESQTPV